MATISYRIREHDVVALRRSVGRWPADQKGTVVAEKEGWKLVEIADDQGVMLDLISVRDRDLSVVAQSRA